MQVTGKITAEMPIKQGKTKDGNDWRTKRYVVRYDANDKYEKTIAFDVYGDNIERFGIVVGKTYAIDIDITARQYNGDYFNQLRAWRCEAKDDAGNTPTATANQK